MKIQFAFFLLLLLHSFSFSQNYDCKEDLLPQQGDNRMWGYINLFGEWKVIPFYDRVFPFQGNIAIVLKGKKYGLLDCDGKVVLRPEYDEIKSFTNGYAWVKRDGKWGIIDYNGKLILQPEYEEVEDVSAFSDYAWVKKSGVWGVFSKPNQSFVHVPSYRSYKMLNSKFSLVKNNESLLGIIDYTHSTPVVEPQLESAIKIISNALAVEKNGKFGLMSDEGEALSAIAYDSIKRVHQYRLRFSVDGKSFLADEEGKRLSEGDYDGMHDYNGGAFRVKKNGKYGFLNYFGREAIAPQYLNATDFVGGKAIVFANDSMYVINPQNELITKGYQEILRPQNGYFLVKENGLWGVMDYNTTLKIPAQFTNIFFDDEGSYVRAQSEKGFFILNMNRFEVVNQQPYATISAFDQHTAIVSNNNRYGTIDTLNQIRIPMQYKSISRLPNYKFVLETDDGFFISDARGKTVSSQTYIQVINDARWPVIVETNKGVGLLNEKGVEIIEPRYSSLKWLGEGYFSIQKGKKVGVIDESGKEVLPIIFEEVAAFSERFFLVKKMKGDWGYLDARAKVMIDFQFTHANAFENGEAMVTQAGKCMIIDKKGTALRSCEGSFKSKN